MGGRNSGRRRTRNVANVESALCLDINRLYLDGCLGFGFLGKIEWTGSGDKRSIGVCTDANSVAFTHIPAIGSAVQVLFVIAWTACRFGGCRPYVLCRTCGRKATKLYWVGSEFTLRCRRCARLSYLSQNLTSVERGRYRAYKIRHRLSVQSSGLPFAPGRDVPPRPTGMWNRTYHRTLEKLASAEEAVEDEYWERLCRVAGRLRTGCY